METELCAYSARRPDSFPGYNWPTTPSKPVPHRPDKSTHRPPTVDQKKDTVSNVCSVKRCGWAESPCPSKIGWPRENSNMNRTFVHVTLSRVDRLSVANCTNVVLLNQSKPTALVKKPSVYFYQVIMRELVSTGPHIKDSLCISKRESVVHT